MFISQTLIVMQKLLQMLLVRLFRTVSCVSGCCLWHWAAAMHVGSLLNTECWLTG